MSTKVNNHAKIYVPRVCKGDEPTFSGEIVMRVPSYEERIDIMLESGTVDLADDHAKSKRDMLSMTRKLVVSSYPFYVKVDLTHIKTKKHFKSVDDLKYSAKTAEILNEVATWLLTADLLGEN